jgi:hypothetical protein
VVSGGNRANTLTIRCPQGAETRNCPSGTDGSTKARCYPEVVTPFYSFKLAMIRALRSSTLNPLLEVS